MQVSQNPITLAITQPQPQIAPFQAACRPANMNACQQLEIAWGLPSPLSLLTYQSQNMGMRAEGQGPAVLQGLNPTVENYGLPPGPNIAQAPVPSPIMGNNSYIRSD